MLAPHKEGILKQQLTINFMGVAKAKYSVKGRNAFHAAFFETNSNCTFVRKNPSCYNVGKGGWAIFKILHSNWRICVENYYQQFE